MKRSVKSNFVFNLICQLIAIIIPLILTPYVSRALGAEGVGLYSYAESIVSYFVLFASLGGATYAQREIGSSLSSKIDCSRSFWEIFLIRLVTSFFVLILYYLFIVKTCENNLIYLILCLNIINVVFDISWFYNGKEEFVITSLISSASKILSAVCVFLFVKNSNDVVVYVLIMSASILLSNVLLWGFLPKYLCKTSKINPFRHVKDILILFIPNIAVQVYSVLDKSMIGWFAFGTEENGYYEYAEKIVRVCITLITALSGVLISKISKNFAEKDTSSLYNTMDKAISYVWFISLPMMFGLFAIADYLVPLYLGDGFDKSIVLIRILSPLVVFVGMASLIGPAFLIPIRKQNVNIIAVVIAAIINAGINLILIPRMYSVGAAIGTVCAEFIGIFIQCFYVFKKKLYNIKSFFIKSLKYLFSSIIMFIVVVLVKGIFIEITVINLFVCVIIGIIVYVIMLFLLRDDFFVAMLNQFLSKVKKKR